MWRVETKRVQALLASLDEFVRDVLEWGVQYQGQAEREVVRVLQESDGRLEQLARKVPRLRKYLLRLTKVDGLERVLEEFVRWTEGYGGVLSGKWEISDSRAEFPPVLGEMFRYFYEDLWDTESLWEVYPSPLGSLGRVTKRDFRRVFSTYRAICPYCDVHRIRHERSSTTDHFLPLSTHPLLAVHWQNLVVSCPTCNLYVKGSTRIRFPIYHPYFHQLADHLSFQFGDEEVRVQAVEESEELRVSTYCTLFQIEDAYQDQSAECRRLEREIWKLVKRSWVGAGDVRDVERLVREELFCKRDELREMAGEIPMTKFLYDYCCHLLREPQLSERVEYFARELGVLIANSVEGRARIG